MTTSRQSLNMWFCTGHMRQPFFIHLQTPSLLPSSHPPSPSAPLSHPPSFLSPFRPSLPFLPHLPSRRMCCTIFVLAIALILMLAAGFIGGAWLGLKEVGSHDSNDVTDETDSKMCLTESCVKLSALILSGVDTTIDPCQDFYNFSCGLWQDNNYVPDG